MKYYAKIKESRVILIGSAYKIPEECVQITASDYSKYLDIINSVDSEDGREPELILNVDFTYELIYKEESNDND